MTQSSTQQFRQSQDRVPGLGEVPAHWALILLGASVVAARNGSGFTSWDITLLIGFTVAWLWFARWWVLGSRLLLVAAGAAATSLWAKGAATGGYADAVAHTLATSQAQILLMTLASFASLASQGIWLGTERESLQVLSRRLVLFGTVCGVSALALRWRESYELGAHLGHVPISNLYEVMVLFVVIVSFVQLRLGADSDLRRAGVLVSLIPAAAGGFIIWYATARGAHEIQPLVPALDSYWMKLHVPANFIGYGAFCVAAMLAAARLMTELKPVRRLLPSGGALDEAIYRLIAVGFVFFTVATILGSLWAAEAWGGYWSWDPKETWALIVWLNYAAWLHMRLVKRWGGVVTAWWAVIGLAVTLFAFLGVNIYLSGMHSYGGL